MSGDLGSIGFIVVAGALTTYVWRVLGVMLAERIDPEGELLLWVRCVATSIVAALCAGIVLSPNRILAVTSLDARIIAMAAGVACFYIFRCNTGAGVAASVVALFAAAWFVA